MEISDPTSQGLRNYTNVQFEIFIVAFSLLPFVVLAYFYSELPDRVPLFMKLNGDVAVWTEKNLLSVFRVPLMALDTQLFCFVTKYGVVQSDLKAASGIAERSTELRKREVRLTAGLLDWFRCLVAIKLSAASLDTIFLSVDRYKFLAKPAFVVTAIAALLSIAGALFYAYRWYQLKREIKTAYTDVASRWPINVERVYGRVLYFNPSDPVLFVNRYVLNFGNKWAWVFIGSIVAYPILVFSGS